ncbi:hypothetical protein P170DRAFT_506516 [Aspergillus steynii IBT 23096]|uniref:Zn(2)-C6 fungal-type domain-containing protein n=1 Tax=Aspergillus steynii IBT 23096 TaxID=1392250 RepID=A0A2I2GFB1_9EURO|nr:uncharacterized protein P170DRAFT_506516 [Aspergillus steynii IBT 23096]PLB51517.1 hypothetical protein P170DRAFT_506516 [Aspergillus steynii IBT 23096]
MPPLPRLHSESSGLQHRSKTGCGSCRRRKKKCDETHPVCNGCQRNNLACTWPGGSPSDKGTAPQTRRPRRRQNLADGGCRLPPELAGMVTVFATPSDDLVRRLLTHFSHFGPTWLTSRIGTGRTRILGHLFPETMESPLILNCVLMVAAGDLVKYDPFDVRVQAAAVEFYGNAVEGLRDAVGMQGPTGDVSDHNLLAVLLFCLHETQNYTSQERLIPHLNAAATLITQRLHTVPGNSELRKFLLEMFCYLFSLTSFSHSSLLSLHQGSQIFDTPGLMEYLQGGAILGTSQKALFVVYRVSKLLSQLSSTTPNSQNTDGDLDPKTRSKLLATETQLQTTQPPFSPTPDMNTETLSDGITFEFYRLACLIYLRYTVAPSTPIKHPYIQSLVTQFITYLSYLPESPSDGFICWPVVIVGLCAVQKEHRGAIATKLKKTHERWRSDIFTKSLGFLRAWWRGREGDGSGSEYGREGQSLRLGIRGVEFPVLLL